MKTIINFKKILLIILIGSYTLVNLCFAKTIPYATGGSSDTIPPVITLGGKDTVHVEILGNYTEEGAIAMDNVDGDISYALVLTGSVNTLAIGVYTLTYTVKDAAGNKSSMIRVVIVADTQIPVISNSDANVSNEVKVQIGSTFINNTKVTDNFDSPKLIETLGSSGNVNAQIMGVYPIEYNATDQSGNKAVTQIYKFKVDDFISPTIELNTLETITWSVNTVYVPVEPTIKDNFYPLSQITVTRTDNINIYRLGVYYEEYLAIDASGNASIRRRYVRIIDDEAPVINGKYLQVAKFSTPDLTEGLTIMDNFDSPHSLFPRLKVLFDNVNTSVDGMYIVTFQVSDLSGNLSKPFERDIIVGSPNLSDGASHPAGFNKNERIKIYPNPSSGVINLETKFESPENMEIQIYNHTGKLVAQFNGNHSMIGIQTLDLSKESAGLYSVRVWTNTNTFSQKILIIK